MLHESLFYIKKAIDFTCEFKKYQKKVHSILKKNKLNFNPKKMVYPLLFCILFISVYGPYIKNFIKKPIIGRPIASPEPPKPEDQCSNLSPIQLFIKPSAVLKNNQVNNLNK